MFSRRIFQSLFFFLESDYAFVHPPHKENVLYFPGNHGFHLIFRTRTYNDSNLLTGWVRTREMRLDSRLVYFYQDLLDHCHCLYGLTIPLEFKPAVSQIVWI